MSEEEEIGEATIRVPKSTANHITLRHMFKAHEDTIWQLAWSPDGARLASGSQDNSVRIWDGHSGHLLHTLVNPTDTVLCVAWSPDGTRLASGSNDNTIRIWDGHAGHLLHTLEDHSDAVLCVAWSPDGTCFASGSGDNTIRIWDGHAGHLLHTLEDHSDAISCVAWSPDGTRLASGSVDNTIRIWASDTWQLVKVLEGHTEWVDALSFSNDGRFLASKSTDSTVRIWNSSSWETVELIEGIGTDTSIVFGVAFHPHDPILATVSPDGADICIWDVNTDALLNALPIITSVHYTSVKIALVGDSGVGKSGLGYRIAEDRFEKTESTHGQQFWVVEKLVEKQRQGTQCEAVLWDFAGQPNFRPIHALFLDDIDLALVVFDPARADTLTAVEYWLKQLSHKQHNTILVAARTDVSQMTLSPAEFETFCREHGINGGFVATSAKTSAGIDDLTELIRQQIAWDTKPTTVTTETFKRIKDYVLELKAGAVTANIIVTSEQLREQLEENNPDWEFSDTEMLEAVRHLQNHGYVTILRRSSHAQSILLAPDLLINLAASFLLRAQANEKGLGSLEEALVLHNAYRFNEVEALGEEERETLVNAAIELFLSHSLCFRESIDNRTFLIFPSLILERPPRLVEDTALVEDITYVVTGEVENLYAALVVLLGYSPTFQRMNQWRKRAQYETVRNEICGFRSIDDDAGKLELVLYYGKDVPEFVRSRFQGLFEEILYTRQVKVKKYAPVTCPKCNQQKERSTVIEAIENGEKFLYCSKDGRKIILPKQAERLVTGSENRQFITREQTLINMRTSYETALSSVKRFINDEKPTIPTCFISYAWGDPEQERWVLRLARDLKQADLNVILDKWDNAAIGASITRFVSRIETCDFILAIGTPSYRQKYENEVSPKGSVVAAEIDLIDRRYVGTEAQKATILPLLLAGDKQSSFPPFMQGRVHANFVREEDYLAGLFDLVLTLYSIPFDDPLVVDLREKLRDEAKNFTTRGRARKTR